MRMVQPPDVKVADIDVYALTDPQEWDDALALQIQNRPPEFEEAAYSRFKTRQMGDYKRLCDNGLGIWCGAFYGGRLVGDCGVFCDGRLARYQQVEVDQPFRNRGIGKALVSGAARQVRERFDAAQLIICADLDYHAKDVYRALGFEGVGRDWNMFKSNRHE